MNGDGDRKFLMGLCCWLLLFERGECLVCKHDVRIFIDMGTLNLELVLIFLVVYFIIHFILGRILTSILYQDLLLFAIPSAG